MKSIEALRDKIRADDRRLHQKKADLEALKERETALHKRWKTNLIAGDTTEDRDLRAELDAVRQEIENLTEQIEILSVPGTGLEPYLSAVSEEIDSEYDKLREEYERVAEEAKQAHRQYQEALKRLREIEDRGQELQAQERSVRQLAGERHTKAHPFIPPIPPSYITSLN